MQDNPARRALDPDGQLDQPLAQQGDLGASAGGPGRPALQLLKQDVGGQREQDPELIGQEPRATPPVQFQP